MSQRTALEAFCAFFNKLDKSCTEKLCDVYTQDIVFIDPLHRIDGRDALQTYFAALYDNVRYCRFTYHDTRQDGDIAFITWTMHFAHSRLAGGRDIVVDGCTRLHLAADGRVSQQRDYFDAGAMLYENVPLLGKVTRFLKRRASG